MTLERKVRWVKDGHKTPEPEWCTFAGVVSRESIRHKTKKYTVRISEETNAGRVYDGTDKREQNNRKRPADSQHAMNRQKHTKRKKIKKKESKMAQDTNFDVHPKTKRGVAHINGWFFVPK